MPHISEKTVPSSEYAVSCRRLPAPRVSQLQWLQPECCAVRTGQLRPQAHTASSARAQLIASCLRRPLAQISFFPLANQ